MNQITIFDLLQTPPAVSLEPETLLGNGNRVYKVSRGEVYEYLVQSNYLVEHAPDERFYTLKQAKGNCFNNCKNSDVEESVFLNKADAEDKARDYLSNHKVWLSSSICLKEAKAFVGERRTDGHKLIAWYGFVPGVLGEESGLLYLKEPMSYIHAIDFKTEKAARKWLETSFRAKIKNYGLTEQESCGSIIKSVNLYPCDENSDWDWAEDGYGYLKEGRLVAV